MYVQGNKFDMATI